MGPPGPVLKLLIPVRATLVFDPASSAFAEVRRLACHLAGASAGPAERTPAAPDGLGYQPEPNFARPIFLRLVASVIPVGQLWVGKLIIDQVVRAIQGRLADPHRIWTYLGYEIALAVLSDLLSRAVNLSDSLLGDKFTNHVSLRLMEHANRLDLVSFEDPVFYDKLERARRQTTARLGMLGVIAGMGQQVLTLLSLSGCGGVVFALVSGAVGGRGDSGVPGRDPFCDAGLFHALPLDSRAPRAGLSAHAGRQQPKREGSENLRPGRTSG